MKSSFSALFAAALLGACSAETAQTDDAPDMESWTLAEASIFPEERSLARPEDGVVLPDGRLIIADLRHGLIELSPEGKITPFGNFADAGFAAEGTGKGGPNGVHLSHDEQHILVADIFTGTIYRTDVASGTTEAIYRHGATVNTAISDSTGAIWFTQSTDGLGEERMFAAVDKPMGDGGLYRLVRKEDGSYADTAELLVEGLNFANGFHLDEGNGTLYLSETVANRVLAFDLDVTEGAVANRRTLAEIPTPDNMHLDADGMLWVASPLANRVYVIDPSDGSTRIGFDAQTEAGAAALAEWSRRGDAGESRLDVLGPEISGEMPGLLTGLVMDRNDRPIFVTGLGDAIVRLER